MSTENPTPETDALFRAQNFDSHIQSINAANALTKHARTLERQRDEARAEAKEATEERDAALSRAALHEYSHKALLARITIEEENTLRDEVERLTKELAETKDMRDRLHKARRELQSELATLRAQSQDHGAAIGAAIEAVIAALKHWQYVWKETQREWDDCMPASDAADKALELLATVTNSQQKGGERREAPAAPQPTTAKESTVRSFTLTTTEILDLAKAANLIPNVWKTTEDELETEYTIFEKSDGVMVYDDDKTPHIYAHGAYITEYPDEGTFPLGPELRTSDPLAAGAQAAAPATQGTTSDPEGAATLESAIAHAQEISKRNEGTACGSDHRQLAGWLRELQWLRTPPPNTRDEAAMTLAHEIALALYPKREDERQYPMFLAYRERAEHTVEPILTRLRAQDAEELRRHKAALGVARDALGYAANANVNGYNFAELLAKAKELLIRHGGYQNGYAISQAIETRSICATALTAIDKELTKP